jgi:hypothetical protein
LGSRKGSCTNLVGNDIKDFVDCDITEFFTCVWWRRVGIFAMTWLLREALTELAGRLNFSCIADTDRTNFSYGYGFASLGMIVRLVTLMLGCLIILMRCMELLLFSRLWGCNIAFSALEEPTSDASLLRRPLVNIVLGVVYIVGSCLYAVRPVSEICSLFSSSIGKLPMRF